MFIRLPNDNNNLMELKEEQIIFKFMLDDYQYAVVELDEESEDAYIGMITTEEDTIIIEPIPEEYMDKVEKEYKTYRGEE